MVRRAASVVRASVRLVKRRAKRHEAVPARPDGDDAPADEAKHDAIFGTAAASTGCCSADVLVAIAARRGGCAIEMVLRVIVKMSVKR